MSIFYLGSYTEMLGRNFGGSGTGIYVVELNEQTGVLTHLSTMETVNPSYMVKSPDKSFLYAVSEVVQIKHPKVKAYRINEDYSLSFVNEISVSGSLPCHIEFQNNNVFVACYGTGNVIQYKVNDDGALVNEISNIKHSGSSINRERQEAPHAHQVVIHPNKNQIFVPDLGIDKVKAYQLKNNLLSVDYNSDIKIPEGLGPRHLVFKKDGKIGYVINELSGDVSILVRSGSSFTFKKNIKSLPDTFTGLPSSSALRIHPSETFLYVANRTLDTITIFKIVTDDLVLVDYTYTQGKTIREFNISPNGIWLIACLQDSNETIVYRILLNGKLDEVYRSTSFTSPVCVAF
ncbi:lactonase family protein [uncultured Algibacter sp.]|uniref:lactonase family protein n=1 Tax=uncultured Algibacter sp. TaxID=298659 RepID=UPI002632A1E9|nr:lactonase family protein [uncultured Algibacter sp.]